jgi:hypothetical protein
MDSCVQYVFMNLDDNGDHTASSSICTAIESSTGATTISTKIHDDQYANVDLHFH